MEVKESRGDEVSIRKKKEKKKERRGNGEEKRGEGVNGRWRKDGEGRRPFKLT